MRDANLMIAAALAALSVACGGGSQPAAPASSAAPAAATAPAAKKAPAEPAASAEPPSAAEHGGVPKDPNERPEAPHGGTLVASSDKALHFEIVFDPAVGRLAIYSYGPDGRTPQKLNFTAIQVSVATEGASVGSFLTLGAASDSETGDRPGESAHFETITARLRGVSKFTAIIRGMPGGEVPFTFPM